MPSRRYRVPTFDRQCMSAGDLPTVAAAWIYAAELADQLGPSAACVVSQHIQSMSGSGDYTGMARWLSVFDKVTILLRAQHGARRH